MRVGHRGRADTIGAADGGEAREGAELGARQLHGMMPHERLEHATLALAKRYPVGRRCGFALPSLSSIRCTVYVSLAWADGRMIGA